MCCTSRRSPSPSLTWRTRSEACSSTISTCRRAQRLEIPVGAPCTADDTHYTVCRSKCSRQHTHTHPHARTHARTRAHSLALMHASEYKHLCTHSHARKQMLQLRTRRASRTHTAPHLENTASRQNTHSCSPREHGDSTAHIQLLI